MFYSPQMKNTCSYNTETEMKRDEKSIGFFGQEIYQYKTFN